MPQIIPAVVAAIAYVGTATTAVVAGTATLAQIATVAAVGIGAAAGSAALSGAMAGNIGSQGAAVRWEANPDAPLRFAFGRVGVKGNIFDAAVYGPDRMYVSFACMLSAAGPINRFVNFRAGDYFMSFNGAGLAINEPYANEMWLSTRRGLQPDTALSLPTGLKNGSTFPGWGTSRKVSGMAAYLVTLGENSKRSAYDGKIPAFISTIEGLLYWDPRLDSTYPGGSGACRLNDPATYVYGTNPILFGLKWALGLWEGPTGKGAPQVDYQVGGIGAKVEGVHVASFVEAANISDANGWESAAWPSTDDDKSQVLDGFLKAGGASYAEIGGKIACIHRAAPRSPVFTVTARDTAGPIEIDTASSKLQRINTIRPRYWSEAHEWEMTALPEVTSSVWQIEDGQGVAVKRTRGADFTFVPQPKQARELASLEISHSREGIRGRVPLRLYMDPEPGNCFIFDEPDFALSNLKCFVLEVEDDTDNDTIIVTFETETDGKYPFAYGQAANPPPSQELDPVDPRDVTPPLPDDWTIVVRPPAPGGGQIPGFDLTGFVSNDTATAVLVEWGFTNDPTDAGSWTQAYSGPPTATSIPITGVDPGQTYYIAVSYIRGQNTSARTVYGPYVAGALIAQEGDSTPPAVPTGLSLTSTSTADAAGNPTVRVSASWTAVTDEDLDGYDTEITEAAGTPITRTVVTPNDQWAPARTGITYSVRVRARDKSSNVSAWTSAVTVVGAGDTTPPSAPTSLTAAVSVGSVFLQWVAPPQTDTTAIEVYENTANDSATATLFSTVNAIASRTGGFTRSGLSSGNVRYYWVKAVDTSGNRSGFSAGVTATIPAVGSGSLDTTPPGVPSGLSLSSPVVVETNGDRSTSVLATWSAVADGDLSGYEVEVVEAGGNPIVRLAGTNRDQFPARAGVSYVVRVRSYDGVGNRSAWTATQTITAAVDTTAPGAPSPVFLTMSLSSAFVRWAAPNDADVAAVEVYSNTTNNSGTSTLEARVNASPSEANGWSKSGLTTGQTVFFWLRAVDTSGNRSAFSTVVTGTVPSVGVTDFASTIVPPELMTAAQRLAATPALGRLVFDTTDRKLYRGTGSAWDRSTDGADIIADSITAGQIAAGAISTTELAAGAITAEKIGALQITSEKIAADAITAEKIVAGTITGDRFNTGTSLPGTITVGGTGVTIGTLQDQAANPASVINGNTTRIDPGLITISGATRLSDWRQAGDATRIAGGSISANTIDANKLTVGSRGVTFDRLDFTSSGNTLSWTNGRVVYVDNDGVTQAFDVSAGSYAYVASDATYIYWVQGATALSTTKSAAVARAANTIVVATYYGANNFTATFGRTIIDGDLIKTGSIQAGNIAAGAIVAGKLSADAVVAANIAAGAITAEKILAGSITGDRFNTGTSLPGTITVGATGVSIGTVEGRAANPAAVINGGSTTIDPGLILISGSTRLSDWRQGGDSTRIAGGSISANTIEANKLKIGARGVNFDRLDFTTSGNTASWTNGRVTYVDDLGATQTFDINPGSYVYAGSDITYIYWSKGASALSTTKSAAVSMGADVIVLATYYGGTQLSATYGRTIIDGPLIKTGAITASKISVDNLQAVSAVMGTLTAGKVQDAATTTFLDLINSRAQFRRGGYDLRLGTIGTGVVLWYGPTSVTIGAESRTNGVWAFGDDGVVYYGNVPLVTGGGATSRRALINIPNTLVGGAFVLVGEYTLSNVTAGPQGVVVSATFVPSALLYAPSGPGSPEDLRIQYYLNQCLPNNTSESTIGTAEFSTTSSTATVLGTGTLTGTVKYLIFMRAFTSGEAATIGGKVDLSVAPAG